MFVFTFFKALNVSKRQRGPLVVWVRRSGTCLFWIREVAALVIRTATLDGVRSPLRTAPYHFALSLQTRSQRVWGIEHWSFCTINYERAPLTTAVISDLSYRNVRGNDYSSNARIDLIWKRESKRQEEIDISLRHLRAVIVFRMVLGLRITFLFLHPRVHH